MLGSEPESVCDMGSESVHVDGSSCFALGSRSGTLRILRIFKAGKVNVIIENLVP